MKKRRSNGATDSNGNRRRRKNGTGTLERRGDKWLARWYVYDAHGNRLRQSQTIEADTLDDARKELRRLTEGDAIITREKILRETRDKLEGVEAERRNWESNQPALTISDAWDAFDGDLTSKNRDPATQTNYGQWYNQFTAWLASTHSDIKELREVNATIAREYAAYLLGKVRGTTYNRHLNALALIWTTLSSKDTDGAPIYPDARLGGNPFAWDKRSKTGIPRITLKKDDKPNRRRVLNLDELARIMNAAQGEMKVLIALGFYTGLRLGDCALLRWDNIDRVNGIITTTSRKTDTETNPRIHWRLKEIIENNVTTTSGYLLPEIAALYNGGTTGRVKLVKMIAALFQSVGIKTSTDEGEGVRSRPDCGFHSLRHTYVTQLERVGATLAERQLLAGHHTAAMTKHYTHDDRSRVLALPDITAGAEEAADGRFRAFCATWEQMTEDERTRALSWIADHKDKGKGE